MSTTADLADLEISPFTELTIAADAPPDARPSVSRDDPLPMAALMPPRAANGAIWQGIDDPQTAIHPFAGECKMCAMKEPAVITPLDQLWRQVHPALAPGWFAVNCCDACYADAQRDTITLEKQREWWASHCPIEFRDEWDDSKGSAKLFSRVMAFNPAGGKGMVIHGPTEAGKTRVVWRLLKHLAETGTEWMFIEAIDLLDTIPERAFGVPLLVIDDLGNDALTGPKEVRLLKLLRTRCNWHRPFIVTTQFTGDALAKRFSENATAQAVIRRLRTFCESVNARATI